MILRNILVTCLFFFDSFCHCGIQLHTLSTFVLTSKSRLGSLCQQWQTDLKKNYFCLRNTLFNFSSSFLLLAFHQGFFLEERKRNCTTNKKYPRIFVPSINFLHSPSFIVVWLFLHCRFESFALFLNKLVYAHISIKSSLGRACPPPLFLFSLFA